MTEKMTKKDYFNELVALATGAGRTDLVDFCNTQIEQLDKKAEKAKQTAAKKKEEDPYIDVVFNALTSELATVDEIVNIIGDEDFTVGKARARLKKLVDAGTIVKDTVKVDKRKLTAYRLVD